MRGIHHGNNIMCIVDSMYNESMNSVRAYVRELVYVFSVYMYNVNRVHFGRVCAVQSELSMYYMFLHL